jgi:hypothetical protein
MCKKTNSQGETYRAPLDTRAPAVRPGLPSILAILRNA